MEVGTGNRQGFRAGATMGKAAVILILSWLGIGVVAIECLLHF
jgi:hypothetical protein